MDRMVWSYGSEPTVDEWFEQKMALDPEDEEYLPGTSEELLLLKNYLLADDPISPAFAIDFMKVDDERDLRLLLRLYNFPGLAAKISRLNDIVHDFPSLHLKICDLILQSQNLYPEDFVATSDPLDDLDADIQKRSKLVGFLKDFGDCSRVDKITNSERHINHQAFLACWSCRKLQWQSGNLDHGRNLDESDLQWSDFSSSIVAALEYPSYGKKYDSTTLQMEPIQWDKDLKVNLQIAIYWLIRAGPIIFRYLLHRHDHFAPWPVVCNRLVGSYDPSIYHDRTYHWDLGRWTYWRERLALLAERPALEPRLREMSKTAAESMLIVEKGSSRPPDHPSKSPAIQPPREETTRDPNVPMEEPTVLF